MGARREFLKRQCKLGQGGPNLNDAIRSDKPWVSDSAGVPPHQAGEFNQMIQDAGIVGAYHQPDGRLVCESKKARNAVLRLRGIGDNDACYGDYAGENR